MDFVRTMRRHSVEVLNRADGHVRCLVCGRTWAVPVTSKLRLSDASWRCPQGCNVRG